MPIVIALVIAFIAFKIVTHLAKNNNVVDTALATGRSFVEDTKPALAITSQAGKKAIANFQTNYNRMQLERLQARIEERLNQLDTDEEPSRVTLIPHDAA